MNYYQSLMMSNKRSAVKFEYLLLSMFSVLYATFFSYWLMLNKLFYSASVIMTSLTYVYIG